eukprot:TRINITY_DN7629_c1_g2_i1.p1 TRINITY_DN7629_c1_g2~~TRINITY_DN7629_c1_g2_i1.p1  ORF type:complete len:1733 (+),score=72.80 TRINITY_DN7629_c1_g2_i1:935-6133(+)
MKRRQHPKAPTEERSQSGKQSSHTPTPKRLKTSQKKSSNNSTHTTNQCVSQGNLPVTEPNQIDRPLQRFELDTQEEEDSKQPIIDLSQAAPSLTTGSTDTQPNEEAKLNPTERRRLYMQNYRKNMNNRKREATRKADKLRRAKARISISPEEKEKTQSINTCHRRAARSSLVPEEKEEIRNINSNQHRSARRSLAPEEKEEIRKLDSNQRRTVRSNLAPEEKEEIQRLDTSRRREARASLESEQEEEIKESDRLRRQGRRAAKITTIVDCARFTLAEFTAECVKGRNVYKDEKDSLQYGRYYIGDKSAICCKCKAQMWTLEKHKGKPRKLKFSICCNYGKMSLPPITPSPKVLADLYTGSSTAAKEFREKVRAYNSALSFASLRANVDKEFANSKKGMYSFRVQGTIHHSIGSIDPSESDTPKFLQIFFYDPASEVDNRLNCFSDLNREILQSLQDMLHNVNPYYSELKTLMEEMKDKAVEDYSIIIKAAPSVSPAYNPPTVPEIAALLPIEYDQADCRDILLYKRGGTVRRIDQNHISYDPLLYVLLFPHGDPGWYPDMKDLLGKSVTQMDYFSYRLQFRPHEGTPMHYACKLFQQYIVDCYAKIDQYRLNWHRGNQKTLRSDLYRGIQDAIHNGDTDFSRLGRRVILPSTYIGGPRNMCQLYQDAMCLVRSLSHPDLFITFTCNPGWSEIVTELKYDPSPFNRPDIIARVFKLKLKQFMEDLTKNYILGKVAGYISVIEFQKRGLPHCHILLILEDASKPKTVEEYNKLVAAEIPDPEKQPQLYDTVTRCMMHGPCGTYDPSAKCMKNGVCTKSFPKKFMEATSKESNGYPLYMRRDNGRTVKVRSGIFLDNRYVVAYNPWLCTKYNAHINVEVCSTITAIKYLYKYVYKGQDKIIYELQRVSSNSRPAGDPINEVDSYLNARYISPIESAWRIFGFSLHKQHPSIQRLALHLEDEQNIYYSTNEGVASIRKKSKTTLTQYFKLNKRKPEARNYLYVDIPKHYWWSTSTKEWEERKRLTGCIGRIYYVSPSAGERFYLRVLLQHVKGATSFKDLRTDRETGEVYPTFQRAAASLGLVENDAEWARCLREAAITKNALQVRNLFAYILIYCSPTEPGKLWRDHIRDFTDDYILNIRRAGIEVTEAQIDVAINKALIEINRVLRMAGRDLANYPGMPLPDYERALANSFIAEERGYNIEEQKEICRETVGTMNEEQYRIYEAIMKAVTEGKIQNNAFFIDGPAGTGKTFLYKAILATVRSERRIALAVASSGIAALLLEGGRTAHSRFKIPIRLDEASTCYISVNSSEAELLCKSSLVIWDEAPMQSKFAFEAVDRTLRDIMGKIQPECANYAFGGKVVVLGGDYRQVLPVVVHGSRAEIVQQTLKQSYLWRTMNRMKLTENMRIRQLSRDDAEIQRIFSDFLLRIGNGTEPHITIGGYYYIRIPDSMLIRSEDIANLIEATFPNLSGNYRDKEYITGRAILTPINSDVSKINREVTKSFPGNLRIYYSADTVSNESPGLQNQYPSEYINSFTPSGLPPHKLCLKVGMPVMLLKNMNPELGLCNGCRLICKKLHDNFLEVEITTGRHAGRTVYFPRLALTSDDVDMPFHLTRRQFPVTPCFCMTINKAQGQSLKQLGLYLPDHVFGHGQLYVALSRVSSAQSIKVLTLRGKVPGKEGLYTKNIVYGEVLCDMQDYPEAPQLRVLKCSCQGEKDNRYKALYIQDSPYLLSSEC